MSWKYRVVGVGEEAPDQLTPHPLNPSVHTKAQKDYMRAIFDEVGWVDEIIVNQRTGYMLNGHMRADLALERGESTVPVKYVDLDESDELKVLATFDPIKSLAGRDSEHIKEIASRVHANSDTFSIFLQSLTPAAVVSSTGEMSRPATPHLSRSAQYFGASGHTLLLSFDGDTYSEILPILLRARDYFGVETNSEVVAALLFQFDSENSDG